MNGLDVLNWFYVKVAQDARISVAHIGLYSVLFQLWNEQGNKEHIEVFGHELRERAKISSTATYIRLLHNLCEYGYIRYLPSYYYKKRSKVVLLFEA